MSQRICHVGEHRPRWGIGRSWAWDGSYRFAAACSLALVAAVTLQGDLRAQDAAPNAETPAAEEDSRDQTADRALSNATDWVIRPDLFQPLVEPPCSYCVNQQLKGLVRSDDRVIAWLRAVHNGGAIPVRHFLAGPRVINDTYGLFFYDPDGDYIAAYEKNYGFSFYGWHRGVMVVASEDGTLWSALTGRAIEGPRKGERLNRIASMPTEWGYWLMLHPESTAYDLFDGDRYAVVDIPDSMSEGARKSLGTVDPQLAADQLILGIDDTEHPLAVPLPVDQPRAAISGQLGQRKMVVFWYGPTRSAVAYSTTLDSRELTFYADDISPETAPIKDHQTGTRWTLAGRAVDGPLRGSELDWIPSIQCRWYAWSHEHPETDVQQTNHSPK